MTIDPTNSSSPTATPWLMLSSVPPMFFKYGAACIKSAWVLPAACDQSWKIFSPMSGQLLTASGGIGMASWPAPIPFTRSSIPPIIAKPSHVIGPRTIIRLNTVIIAAAKGLLLTNRTSQLKTG
jgi:hypothetical protein